MGFLTQRSARFAGPTVRPLTEEDADGLLELIESSPEASLFPLEHYERIGLPRPSLLTRMYSASPFIGVFENVEGREESAAHRGRYAEQRLTGAVWFGSNLVPVRLEAHHLPRVADYVLRTRKRPASVFGPASAVMGLWHRIFESMPQPFDVRPDQPLLRWEDAEASARAARRRMGADISPVRWAREGDQASLLPASVAMFTEEVGYSPMNRDPQGYAEKVLDGIRSGRAVVAVDRTGEVVFKTDVGLAARGRCQLQGVWLAPRLRGQGLSEILMAQVCELLSSRFSSISLYVNDYNAPARALYDAVGFRQIGTFATVLL